MKKKYIDKKIAQVSVEEIEEIIKDINFESYVFSHEEVANKTAKLIHDRIYKDS